MKGRWLCSTRSFRDSESSTLLLSVKEEVLKLHELQNHLDILLKKVIKSTPRVSDLVGLGQDLGICISKKTS